MSSWCDYHNIALILATILQTIVCVYLQLSGENLQLAALQALQSNQCCILHSMTSGACALSTARHDVSRVQWLYSGNNLRRPQFALKWMRSERSKWCMMQKRCRVSETYLIVSTKTCLEASHSWGAWRFEISRLGGFGFVNQQNIGYESTLSYYTSWTKKSQELKCIYCFFPPTPPINFSPVWKTPPPSWTILTHATCTEQRLSFQNTFDNLHNCLCSLSVIFYYMDLYYNANAWDVDPLSTHRDGTKGQLQSHG